MAYRFEPSNSYLYELQYIEGYLTAILSGTHDFKIAFNSYDKSLLEFMKAEKEKMLINLTEEVDSDQENYNDSNHPDEYGFEYWENTLYDDFDGEMDLLYWNTD